MRAFYNPLLLLFVLCCAWGCRGEYEIIPSDSITTQVFQYDDIQNSKIRGFYLLCEGNMGSNKASLDFMDLHRGIYHRNIYAEKNPEVVKELGDVGNDIQVYGTKAYAVINVSNYIEVMDAKTGVHLVEIKIPNVRYIRFKDGYAYASSYVAPVQFDQNARPGYVVKIDTLTLEKKDSCIVGFQPEELDFYENKLYVANSGGYMFPNYDRTVSVIDLNTFKEIKKIDVAINLHRLRTTKYGEIIVSSRGDYYDVPSALYFIDPKKDVVTDRLDLPVSNFDIVGDSAYLYAVSYSKKSDKNRISYAIFNIRTHKLVTDNFITDGTEKDIEIPYGIKVHPDTKDIFITDAKDYVSPGTLLCYSPKGKLKWKVFTGDIPGHFAFVYK